MSRHCTLASSPSPSRCPFTAALHATSRRRRCRCWNPWTSFASRSCGRVCRLTFAAALTFSEARTAAACAAAGPVTAPHEPRHCGILTRRPHMPGLVNSRSECRRLRQARRSIEAPLLVPPGASQRITLPHRSSLRPRRVTTGSGGEHIIKRSKEVMGAEFPELAERIKFHFPDETEKRHGQAIAAASLPKIS